MNVRGEVVAKLGDNIDTDAIIPFRWKAKTIDYKELAKHVFEDYDPSLVKKIKEGSILVAGENFGMGSSREQAPIALKYAGVRAIIAKSFARIFFRNAINLGLIVVESKDAAERVEEGDVVEIDLEKGVIRNLSKGEVYPSTKYPSLLLEILKEGSIYDYFRKHGRLPWDQGL